MELPCCELGNNVGESSKHGRDWFCFISAPVPNGPSTSAWQKGSRGNGSVILATLCRLWSQAAILSCQGQAQVTSQGLEMQMGGKNWAKQAPSNTSKPQA